MYVLLFVSYINCFFYVFSTRIDRFFLLLTLFFLFIFRCRRLLVNIHTHTYFYRFFSCRYILQRYATLNSACNNLSIWRTTSSSRCVGTISTVIYRRVSMSRFVEAIWWMWRWRQRGNLLRRIVLCCRSVRPIFVKCSLKCQPINMPLVSMRRQHHPPNFHQWLKCCLGLFFYSVS